MKTFFFIIIILFSKSIYSQNNNLFDCDELKKTIVDKSLFDTLSNGKLIARLDRKIDNIYKVTVDNNIFYFVTKPVMKKIIKSIKTNKCNDIRISEVDKIDEIDFKIIRD